MGTRILLITTLILLCHPASGAQREAEAWLDGLYDRVAADNKAGRPLVFQVHVALCDSTIIRCGGHGLGDGESLKTNLYWASSGGFVGWFRRRGSPWTEVHRE